ncbi:LOW QUALITY PROTEIN: peroxisomal biogenesis factor 19 [Pelecanus crispus]|uniref:LOW QUALITY PROTEIN: peroxisomal biogenesis factor 19 n=1 Tax=Pelecanus crispus TaxID=36300 RepID=UPI003F5D3246
MAAEPGPGPDPELEELLDSALDDFEKARPAAPPPPPPPPPPGAQPSPSAAAKASLFASQERFFQELFEGELASQAAAEFEQAMQELAREEPHLVEQFQKLSEAAGRVGSDAASQQEFTSCLKETLSGLAKNATDLQNPSASEEELAKALEGLGLEEGDGEGSVLPVMRSIMQSLLSKDVLYPSLKEITEKYPEWLQRHGEALPAEQYERYRAQHGVMGRICQQLEGERPGEGEEERRARFETLLDLMQQLQDLGHPPKELAGESPPGFNPELPGAAGGEQCRLM